jgi:hypothetical protein
MELDALVQTARLFYYLPLALWIGATVGVAFVALPAVFRAADSVAAAGAIGELALVRLDRLKIALALPFLAASLFRLIAWENASMSGPVLRFAAGAAMVAIDLAGALLLLPKLRALRPAAAASPAGSTERIAFDRLQARSVRLTSIALLAGTVAVFLS